MGMLRRSDLSPPLGKPGGPCQVVRRIERQVKNPALKQNLIDEVNHGEDLTNAEAAKVYPIEVEPGVGPARQLRITSHAQYRLDLRGISVGDVRGSLEGFFAQLETWRKLGSPAYATMRSRLDSGEPVEWVSRTRLKVIFRYEAGICTLISAYWRGVSDPPPPAGACKMSFAQRVAGRHLVATGYFAPGDLVLYGKWKNKRGVIVRLFTDEHGNPAVEIEPIPKGRKKNKIFGLFRIWHADLEKRVPS